jgi:hypothetical protein
LRKEAIQTFYLRNSGGKRIIEKAILEGEEKRMKITEELLNEMKIKDENFSDGLIKPDGDYVRIPRGHLHGMMELLPWTENEIWKMIPDDDSPLFWLIEKTGCVLTDYNNSIGMKMTPAQQTAFDMMRKHGVLTDDYYDLTKQREKVREAREQKENKKRTGNNS